MSNPVIHAATTRNRRTLATLVALVAMVVLTVRPAVAQQTATLAWNPSSDPFVTGYNLYYGTNSGIYTVRLPVGQATSVTVSNLAPGVTYYFAVTAVTALGLESPPSAEVPYTVPLGVRLTIQRIQLASFPNAFFV